MQVDLGTGDRRLRIVVLGYIVRGPLGGMVWSNLQFLMGLMRLGHDVYFVEDSDDYPSCYDPTKGCTDIDPAYGLRFAANTFEQIAFKDRWAYYDAHRAVWRGPIANKAVELCQSADLILNLCGVNPLRPWILSATHRVLVDEDPAFTQIRHLIDSEKRVQDARHTAFFTFAENLPAARSQIPDDGFPWQAARQPVVLENWPASSGQPNGKFTTVMQWDSYPGQDYRGKNYGMKSHSFAEYLELPEHTGPLFEIVVGGETAHRQLNQNGWGARDPFAVSRDVPSYEAFIRQSKAEFSVAKHGYVTSHSGWFSERSVAYLASGRPVVLQDTGFTDWLPTGAGVLSFTNLEQAIAAVEEVNARYEFHCRAAREIAAAFFDAKKILPALLDRAVKNTKTQDCHG